MQIAIPVEMEQIFRHKAEAAGFRNVDDYLVDLVLSDTRRMRSGAEVLSQLRQLRQQVPRMSTEEIVSLASEGRDRLR